MMVQPRMNPAKLPRQKITLKPASKKVMQRKVGVYLQNMYGRSDTRGKSSQELSSQPHFPFSWALRDSRALRARALRARGASESASQKGRAVRPGVGLSIIHI